MNDKEIITTVVKNPSAISASISLMTSTQRKMLGVLMREAQKQKKSVTDDKYKFEILAADVKSVLGIDWMDNTDLKKHLDPLMSIRIEYNYFNKDQKDVWGYGVILPGIEIEKGSSYIRFTFNAFLLPMILSPKQYANIDLLTIAKIKVERAVELYEWLVDYIKVSVPYISIKDFRKIMGLVDDDYPVFSDFRRSVLDPIRDEVNDKTDVTCSYRLIRGYKNACIGIQWKVKAKKGCNPTKANTYGYHEDEKIQISETQDVPEIATEVRELTDEEKRINKQLDREDFMDDDKENER
jgi:hypothetical protein